MFLIGTLGKNIVALSVFLTLGTITANVFVRHSNKIGVSIKVDQEREKREKDAISTGSIHSFIIMTC